MYLLTPHLWLQNTQYKIKASKQVNYWNISASSVYLLLAETGHRTCSWETHTAQTRLLQKYGLSRQQKYSFDLGLWSDISNYFLIAHIEQGSPALFPKGLMEALWSLMGQIRSLSSSKHSVSCHLYRCISSTQSANFQISGWVTVQTQEVLRPLLLCDKL